MPSCKVSRSQLPIDLATNNRELVWARAGYENELTVVAKKSSGAVETRCANGNKGWVPQSRAPLPPRKRNWTLQQQTGKGLAYLARSLAARSYTHERLLRFPPHLHTLHLFI